MDAKDHQILIVGNDAQARRALSLLVNHEPGFSVRREVESAAVALEVVRKFPCDAVIAIFPLKGNARGSIDISWLAAQKPGLAILVISDDDETLHAMEFIGAGARGFLMKKDAAQNVTGALRRMLGGGVYVSERVQREGRSQNMDVLPLGARGEG